MLEAMGEAARKAAKLMGLADAQQKNQALTTLAALLHEKQDEILAANQLDIDFARGEGLADALIDRLTLNAERIQALVQSIETIKKLDDPIGKVYEKKTLPNGLKLYKQRVPIGVLAVIYESRPNVTIDVAALALKSGNAVILRGGSETLETNAALVDMVQQALLASGLPAHAVQFINEDDRELVMALLKLNQYVDMVIPRGGAGLHQLCRENSTIPVITGGIGICHLFVDESADLKAALPVIFNAKVQRPSVCNALDTLLVHEKVADGFLPEVIAELGKANVTFKVDVNSFTHLSNVAHAYIQQVEPATWQDFKQEWLGLTLGIKVVSGLEEALAHITENSTGHSDGILTENRKHAARFIQEVDSAAVYVNASTRFTDGEQLGLGAEVAISTQKLHARGPMGLQELTSYKWVITGDYQVRT